MNITNVTIDKTKQMSIQLFIVTGFTTLFYVTSRDINPVLILSTLMYMFILIDWTNPLVKFDF
jgi:hypothetical protein